MKFILNMKWRPCGDLKVWKFDLIVLLKVVRLEFFDLKWIRFFWDNWIDGAWLRRFDMMMSNDELKWYFNEKCEHDLEY